MFEGVAIGKWVESATNRWRNGTLHDDQRLALKRYRDGSGRSRSRVQAGRFPELTPRSV